MKQHYLFSGNETPEQIRQILTDNCEGTDEMTYTKQLTEDELNVHRENYVAANLGIATANDELKTVKERHKLIVKPLKKESAELLRTLKSRHEEVEGKVYLLADHKAGIMEYVNLEGLVVHTRRLKPEEKQGRMFIAKAVNE